MPRSVKRCWNPQHNLSIWMTTIKLWNGSGPFKAATSEFIFPAWQSWGCYECSLLSCNWICVNVSEFSPKPLSVSVCAGCRLRTACRHAVLRRATGPEGAKGADQWVGQRCQVSTHSHSLSHSHQGGGSTAYGRRRDRSHRSSASSLSTHR